jgi:hypothetical protein
MNHLNRAKVVLSQKQMQHHIVAVVGQHLGRHLGQYLGQLLNRIPKQI